MPKVEFLVTGSPRHRLVWRIVDGFLVGPATPEETAEYERALVPDSTRTCGTCGGTGRCESGAT